MVNLRRKWLAYILPALLSLLILLPTWYGFFFLLDDFFIYPYRELELRNFLSNNIGFWVLFAWIVLNQLFPGWILQKALYFWAFFLLSVTGFQLISKQKWGYFAGILMLLNPFVYSRILDGQIGIVMSIALFALGIGFFIQYIETRETKRLIFASIIWALSVMWMPHAIFFVFAAIGIFLLFDWLVRKEVWFLFRTSLYSLPIILLLNVNWIIWSVWKGSGMDSVVSQIWSGHFQAFSTDPGSVGVYFNTLSLHGFWGEREGRYLPTYFDSPNWTIVFLIIFAFVLYGVYVRVFRSDSESTVADRSLLTLGVVSYVLALGISGNNIFAPITQFLYDYIPFYKGLREPQKWVGVLLISYAYFAGHGVEAAYRSSFVQKGYPKLFLLGAFSLPFLYTPTMLFGFQGQLRSADYPREWYALNERFGRESTESDEAAICGYRSMGAPVGCYDMLVFPWHSFLRLSFADRIIANPAQTFFSNTRVLQGDNMEIWSIYTQSIREESRIVEKYVWPKWAFRDGVSALDAEGFVADMRWLGISRILLLKESDYRGYSEWMQELTQSGKVELEEDTGVYVLYRVR